MYPIIQSKAQLEQKTEKWKLEIDAKKKINKLKEALKAERALLTKRID
jgi:hypothetical protein